MDARKALSDSDLTVMKFSPDLTFRVVDSLERVGYCIFGNNELERLFSETREGNSGRLRILEEFAASCGARVETTPHFKSARFTKAAVAKSSGMDLSTGAPQGQLDARPGEARQLCGSHQGSE